MAGKRILVVEDERDIAELISYNLGKEGYQVRTVDSGEAGLTAAADDPPDLVLLDIMLPGMNGLDVCRTLRSREATGRIPIIMLTARDDEIDIVSGLEVGADDYLTKPFSPKVLIAHIRAVLRRYEDAEDAGDEPSVLRIGKLTIDETKHLVTAGESTVDLTPTEFELLAIMARRPGWVFSRSQLIDRLRDGQQVITDRAIDVQIANLRKKLGPFDRYVQTVRGVGYRVMETS